VTERVSRPDAFFDIRINPGEPVLCPETSPLEKIEVVMDMMKTEGFVVDAYGVRKEKASAVPVVADSLRYSSQQSQNCRIKGILKKKGAPKIPFPNLTGGPEFSEKALEFFCITDEFVEVGIMPEQLDDPGFDEQGNAGVTKIISHASDSRHGHDRISDPVDSPDQNMRALEADVHI
jgi:hypothetical protein